MEFAKILSDGSLDLRHSPENMGQRIKELLENGFSQFVGSPMPHVESGYVAVDHYEFIDGKICQYWTVVLCQKTIQDEINDLKLKLDSTDYQVIKCYEANLVGIELPYDINKLHNDRQIIRDKINELQQTVNEERHRNTY